MHKTGETVTVQFFVSDPATSGLVDADALPTGVLVLNGVDNAAAVTVTNLATGIYRAAVTLPAITDGDELQLRIAATVGGVDGGGIVWQGYGVTKRPAEVYALAAAQRVIDQTTTPWQLVLKDRTTGVEIMRFDLQDENGDPIASIATFVAEQTTPA